MRRWLCWRGSGGNDDDHRMLCDFKSGLQLCDAPQRPLRCRWESNTIRVASYQELVNALIYLIGRGRRAEPSALTGRER